MRKGERRLVAAGAVRLLAALCAMTCLGAAALVHSKDEPRAGVVVIWEDGSNDWVRLEPRDDPSAPVNDHPAQLSAVVITSALAAILVKEDDQSEAIFTPDETQLLGDLLSRALAQAGADQDVTFRSTGTRSLGGKILKGVSINSGRVFQQGGKLNVIFGDVHAKAKKKTVYGQWDQDFTKPRPASRAKAAKHDWALVAPPGAELQQSRDDWLVFNSAQLAATAAAAAPAPPAAASAAPPVAGTRPAAPAAATPPMPAAGLSPEADMERRLRALKDLHDQGLITDEAYKAKVEEILSIL
jgi:hypothetical protein